MFGSLAILRYLNVFVLIPYVAGEQSKTLKGCLRSHVESHAEFIEHVHSFLDVPPVGSIKVHDSMTCTLHCLRNEQCYSVNFAVDFDDQGHVCNLLPSDKYNFPYKIQQNVDSFHHYSIAVGYYSVFPELPGNCLVMLVEKITYSSYLKELTQRRRQWQRKRHLKIYLYFICATSRLYQPDQLLEIWRTIHEPNW